MKVIIATHNPGKFSELEQMLAVEKITYLPPTDIEDVEETGQTYVENAILKARTTAKISGRPAIGDDSGLEIFALNSEPGIRSARYAGEDATDAEKRQYILDLMDGVEDRQARFVCSLAFVDPHHLALPTVFTGVVYGSIISEAVGEADPGLQYDSIFYYPPFGETFANVKKWRKNRASHRADACFQMAHYLNGLMRGYNKGFGNL